MENIKIIGKNEIGAYIAKNRNKNKWLLITINNEIRIKLFDLWAQRIELNGVPIGGGTHCDKVGKFKDYIDTELSDYIKSNIVSIEIRLF